MSLVEPQSPAIAFAAANRKGAKTLHIFIVTIRCSPGAETETYWIDAPNKIAARHRAARYAGVSSERVLSVQLFQYQEQR